MVFRSWKRQVFRVSYQWCRRFYARNRSRRRRRRRRRITSTGGAGGGLLPSASSSGGGILLVWQTFARSSGVDFSVSGVSRAMWEHQFLDEDVTQQTTPLPPYCVCRANIRRDYLRRNNRLAAIWSRLTCAHIYLQNNCNNTRHHVTRIASVMFDYYCREYYSFCHVI